MGRPPRVHHTRILSLELLLRLFDIKELRSHALRLVSPVQVVMSPEYPTAAAYQSQKVSYVAF